MATQYNGIIAATKTHMNADQPLQMQTYENYLQTCINMRSYIDSRFQGASDLASKSIEYHSFGVSGWLGGEAVAPMLWSTGHIPQIIGKIADASSAIVASSFNEVLASAAHYETVYTLSCSSSYIYNKVDGQPEPTNIHLLKWSELEFAPKVDVVHVANYVLADRSLIRLLLNAVKPKGVLVVANSSNGGELYNMTLPQTFAQETHDKIMALGDLTSFHFQGYVSFTVYIKNG